MKTEAKTRIAALVIFSLLTLLHLYPLSFHTKDSIHDTGDPLLNTWIISSVQNSLLSSAGKIFEGDIFYPSEKTIAFSEHLFPQSVVTLPLSLISDNPLLIYNILFLFSYILTSYAMFTLVGYLTGDFRAGIVSGIIFSFSAYHLDHIPQLQLLSSGLFVLCFYYLLRYFKEKKVKHSVLFSVFFLLQALACIYYGLFLISVLIIFIPLLILSHWKEITKSFVIRMIFPLLGAGVVLMIFSLPYMSLLKSYGFSRGLADGADLGNYFAVTDKNIVLGKLLSPLGKAEGYFFPGIIALLFLGFYVFEKRNFSHHLPRFLRWLFLIILGSNLLTVLIIIFTGGFRFNFGIFDFSATSLPKPTLLFLGTLFIYIFLSFFASLFKERNSDKANDHLLFLHTSILLWALFLSFGKTFFFLGQSDAQLPLPFPLFYKFFPGFSALRTPSRFGIFVLFGVAVMAGQGLHLLLNKFKKRQIALSVLLVVFILLNIEYLSIPQRLRSVPIKQDIPPTYRWLKEEPEDFAILEYPFMARPGWEAVYMYFSCYHGKKIVNGYSGFIPPSFFFMKEAFNLFPSQSTIDILKILDVKYVVVHTPMLNGQTAQNMKERIELEFADELEMVKSFEYSFRKPWEHAAKFGNDLVYRVNTDPKKADDEQELNGTPIPASDWTIESNTQSALLPLLRDGRRDTRWTAEGYRKTGDYLLIEFAQPVEDPLVTLSLGPWVHDFAIDFQVEVSTDGIQWETIPDGYRISEFLRKLFESPTDIEQKIQIRRNGVRSIKITQIGTSNRFRWSVAELDIAQPSF